MTKRSRSPSTTSSSTLKLEDDSQIEEPNTLSSSNSNPNANPTPNQNNDIPSTSKRDQINPNTSRRRDQEVCHSRKRRAIPFNPTVQTARGPRTAREYFVPQEGIDREVITADITLYLGNDALVRPGTCEDPVTREITKGYFVTSDHNLTEAMIDNLKADSVRWSGEKRGIFSSWSPQNVERLRPTYANSSTHESRRCYGASQPASFQRGGLLRTGLLALTPCYV